MARIRSLIVFSICVTTVAIVFAFATPAIAQQTADFGKLVMQVRPPNAEILIDGVKWAGSDPTAPLTIQLAPGVHHIEISAPDRQTFVRDLTVHAGETIPLNVSLTSSEAPRPKVTPPGPEQPPPPPRPRVPGAPPPSSGQHIQVVPNEDGFVFAPDVRIAEINGQAGTLIGAYGGMVFGGKLLIGAGGYFQVGGYNHTQLNYFGPVFEYRFLKEQAVGFNLHALVGGGVNYGYGNCCYPGYPISFGAPRYYYPNQGFFVFEPEVQVVVRFSPMVRLQGGIGYRVTSGYNNDGVSGSISVQIGK